MVKNIGIVLGIIAILLSAGAYFVASKAGNFAGITHLSGLQVGIDGFSVLGSNATTSFSGATGSTISYQTIQGIDYAYVQKAMSAATTTPCSIPNPFGSATSTLTSYTAQITVGTSTAATYDVATSTTAYATSSPAFVKAHSVASGAMDTMFAAINATSTTANGILATNNDGSSMDLIGPSVFVNLKTAGPGLSGYTWTGTCSAVFAKP